MAENESGLRKHDMEELLAEVERLRAEKVFLQTELNKQKQKLSRRHFPGRNTLALLFIVLGGAAAVLAPMALWAKRSFLDTNNFANIMSPLVANETVARSLSNEVTGRLFVQLEMQKRVKDALQEAVPDKLGFMAGPITNSLQTVTQKITYEIITSPRFQAGWDRILRLAHATVVRIIRGDGLITMRGSGEVVLDTGELMGNVRSRLVGSGLRFLERVPMTLRGGEVVLFTSSQLGKLKAGLDILDTLNWLLPLLVLVFFAAAVLISEDRRRALMWLFVVLLVAMMLSLMLLNLAEKELLGEVKNPSNIGAVRIIWERMTADLARADTVLLILGIIGALAFAIAGPYAWASRTRHKVGQFLPIQRKRHLTE
jgi:hypothetical protein